MDNMKTLRLLSLATLLALSTTASASVVYTNGEISPLAWSFSGNTINKKFSVSDSFTLTNSTTLSSAITALDSWNSTLPTGVTWAIGSQAFGAEYGTGKSSLGSRTPIGTNGFIGSYWTFDLNATLGAGTYWLTLSNAVSESDQVYWLQTTNVTPAAYQQWPDGKISSLENGMYFSLSGDEAKIPEPATLAIVGLGLAAIGATRRRK